MRSPAAPLRGGAVGVLTVVLAVAAHGAAGGGYPSATAAVFLLLVGAGIGGAVTMPSPRSGAGRVTTATTGLAFGQLAAHVALAVGDHHAHGIVAGPTMLASHAAAAVVLGGLVYLAERLYGPITSVVRAILEPPLPLPDASATAIRPTACGFVVVAGVIASISTRGPPVVGR